jgi:hypothetical protein
MLGEFPADAGGHSHTALEASIIKDAVRFGPELAAAVRGAAGAVTLVHLWFLDLIAGPEPGNPGRREARADRS